MGNIIVKQDKRFTKRQSFKALGSLVKVLTEIITNSDDSYRRLKGSNAEDHSCLIDIFINRGSRKISVVDHAEGMDCEDIINNFQNYGADKSGRGKGYKTRGIFGQGASDVLFTQDESKIWSFKDGSAMKAEFLWKDDDRHVDYEDLEKEEEGIIRKKYNIEGNGTVVSFKLDEKISIPLKIFDELRSFYMLRFVMADKTRRIILNFENGKKIIDKKRVYYEFPNFADEEVVYDNLINFKFEENQIKGELKLIKINDKLNKINDFGELKILVSDDENNVYDNTFFTLGDRYPGLEKIHGYLKLYKTADVIRNKLNLDKPEEILLDTRDGLNAKHDFFKKLNETVIPIIEKKADKLNETKDNTVKSSDFKNQKKMFDELNKQLKEELEEIDDLHSGNITKEPPRDGFDFVRDRIKITVDKKYSLKLLVNKNILSKGNKIFIKNFNKDKIDLTPELVEIKNVDDEADIIYYNIFLKGKKITTEDCVIEASNPELNLVKKLFVSVIPDNIHYPKAPLEFYPTYYSLKLTNKSKINLYLNTEKIGVGSEIKIFSTNKDIAISEKKIVVKKENIISDGIALINVYLNSNNGICSGKVIASSLGYLAEADVEFIDKDKPNENNNSGFLSGWELTSNPEAPWQKYLHLKTGKININTGHFINKEYFGENPNIDHIKKNKMSQKYLAEILSDELAQYTVKQFASSGKVNSDYGALVQEHQNQKNKFGKIIYKYKLE